MTKFCRMFTPGCSEGSIAELNIIFTYFLEYESETVKVHDIVYKRQNEKWNLYKNFYRKLRLSKDWVEGRLYNAGFTHVLSTIDNGFITVIATK